MQKYLILLLLPFVNCEEDWQPLFHHHDYEELKSLLPSVLKPNLVHLPQNQQCELYKVQFVQDLYFQYIQYKTRIPEMKEFTLCFWSKFSNHSNDHPVFSYAVDGQPKAISSWISNTERSSYFSLSVEGHTFYRLNYPLRINRWYHTCQSWNGKTGEWQIWVNSERVGRGFHNRLVGHVIPSDGLAITGQEQTQLGGGFMEGQQAPKGSGGMLGEITMLQLYSVALTAGKAHRDHKHHHAHQYDHNGNQITTPPPSTTTPRVTLPTHPLLTSGQLNRMVKLNFANGQQPQIVPGQNYNAQLVNGQFVTDLLSQQLAAARQQSQQPQIPLQIGNQLPPGSNQIQISLPSGQLQLSVPSRSYPATNPANVQFIDSIDTHQLFKRQNKEIKNREMQNEDTPKFGDKIKVKRDTESPKAKRELFIGGGTLVDDSLLSSPLDESALLGLAGIGENEPILIEQKENDEREPAEAEVRAVMNVCSGCDPEPFGKALVFGWRTVPKKIYSGAFYTPAVPQCRVF